MKITTRSYEFAHGQSDLLNDESVVKNTLDTIIKLADLTPLEYTFHRFTPQGISATIILAESHIAVHTWPELGNGYIILTSCSTAPAGFSEQAIAAIESLLQAKVISTQEIS